MFDLCGPPAENCVYLLLVFIHRSERIAFLPILSRKIYVFDNYWCKHLSVRRDREAKISNLCACVSFTQNHLLMQHSLPCLVNR